nr:upf0553 protein [Quercus suber]
MCRRPSEDVSKVEVKGPARRQAAARSHDNATMSDDEADLELLDLLRKSLGINNSAPAEISSDTGVLVDAEFIYNNSTDVFINMYGTKAAALAIYNQLQDRGYSTASWSEQELHPRLDEGFNEVDIINFIFTMDLLNFSFWSTSPESQRYQVEYRGKCWTGYKSLVACLRRALDEDIPITTPRFWTTPAASHDLLLHVFRSATQERIPLLDDRMSILKETGQILHELFDNLDEQLDIDKVVADEADAGLTESVPKILCNAASGVTNDNSVLAAQYPGASDQGEDIAQQSSTSWQARSGENRLSSTIDPGVQSGPVVLTGSAPVGGHSVQLPNIFPPDFTVVCLIEEASRSAGKLVNILAKHFPSFRDETRFDGRKIHFYKRAQIFVADLWAATNGTGYGEFHDIGHLTMFADYRVPQILTSLGILSYSPTLLYAIKDGKLISSGHSWEVQLRGCSIWAVELVRREILKAHPEATNINAVLIDFFLYDLAKEREKEARSRGEEVEKCHRVESIALEFSRSLGQYHRNSVSWPRASIPDIFSRSDRHGVMTCSLNERLPNGHAAALFVMNVKRADSVRVSLAGSERRISVYTECAMKLSHGC